MEAYFSRMYCLAIVAFAAMLVIGRDDLLLAVGVGALVGLAWVGITHLFYVIVLAAPFDLLLQQRAQAIAWEMYRKYMMENHPDYWEGRDDE